MFFKLKVPNVGSKTVIQRAVSNCLISKLFKRAPFLEQLYGVALRAFTKGDLKTWMAELKTNLGREDIDPQGY